MHVTLIWRAHKLGQQKCQQNVINENYENQPYAARTLCPVSEIALCYGSLVPQK